MRAFSLALILANLFFFGWSRLVGSESAAGVAVIGAGPRLLLGNEIALPTTTTTTPIEAVSPADAPASAEPSRPAAVAASTCRSVGPFAELTEAARASMVLRDLGLEPRQRIAQGEFWVGYWVNIPNLGERENAERALATVESQGIPDAYILSTAATSNAISVGVFSEYSNAQARVEELRELGFQPQILDRKRTESLYWIDVDLSTPEQSIDEALMQTDPGKIKRIENRACPTNPPPADATG
jgi:hypothetical protein